MVQQSMRITSMLLQEIDFSNNSATISADNFNVTAGEDFSNNQYGRNNQCE